MTNTFINVSQPTATGKSCWSFWLNGELQLVLDCYSTHERPTARHKWRTTGCYWRLYQSKSTIQEADVPLPPEVVRDALTQVRDRLRVVRWSELRR